MKHFDQNQLRGGKGLFSLQFQISTLHQESQSRIQGWNVKMRLRLLTVPHSSTSDQGTHFTDKELHQDLWRRMLAGWLSAWLVLS